MSGFADVQAAFCAVLSDEWARAGVTDVVLAPGSRSTPMVAAVDAEPRLRVHVVLDERSAGFTAVGLGMATRRPAIVVTTSGTAAVELHPAMVEASQACVPVIAVTTDRPPELHHVGAPQTVEQNGLFPGVTRWAADPGPADLGSSGWWRSLASRAVAEAAGRSAPPGPVHLNLPFREPLLGNARSMAWPPGRPDGAPWHWSAGEPRDRTGGASAPGGAAGADPVVDLLAAHAGGRGVIVAGQGAGEPAEVLRLAGLLGWPLLAEPRSGARTPAAGVVAAADALLRCDPVRRWQPDVVLRVGTPWASKVVGQWLSSLPPDVPQVVADRWGRWADPDRRAWHVAAASAADLAVALSARRRECPPADREPSPWAQRWAAAESAAQEAMGLLLGPGGDLHASEPAVARAVLDAVPAGGQLVVSSSMPIRDVEWYGAPRSPVRVFSNRGANGIDGVVATSIGVALAEGSPTACLIGDLAFLYDAGALLWARQRDIRLTLVVVDNDGGGIFSFLPQATATTRGRFEQYWGTPHGLDLVAVARAYGAEAYGLEGREELDGFLQRLQRPGLRVGVVRSSRKANVEVHDRIHAAVASAVASLPDPSAQRPRPLRAGPERRGGPEA